MGKPNSLDNKHRVNRQRIIDALPGTQLEIANKLKIGRSTVCKWLDEICECKEAYVYKKRSHPNGGPFELVYYPGPKPRYHYPKIPKVKSTAVLSARSKANRIKSGEWEDVKAKERAKYYLRKLPKRDRLTSFFYGEPNEIRTS